MAHKNILFQRLQQKISRHDFESVVGRFHKGAKPRKFTHRNQFDFMLYCILNQARSLRDGLDTFNFHEERLYHLGFKSKPCLSTVSEANTNRSYRGYEELFEILKHDISRRERKEIDGKLKIIDSTTISIDDRRVAWASFRRDKRGLKIHMMLDENDIFPASAVVTPAKSSDITVARKMGYERGCLYVMDRAYFDSKWLYEHQKRGIFFVTRLKKNLIYSTISSKALAHEDLVEENIIQLMGNDSGNYCENLRVIRIKHPSTGKEFDVITNNFELSAEELADIYKKRWVIEIFFKWLKQNLKIRKFFGISENAIKMQIWIALILYLLLWQMYREHPHYCDKFIKFVRYFKTRIFIPDQTIRFRKWKEPPPNLQLELFEIGKKYV